MRLTLQRETLLKPLQTIIGVVERKQSFPILANVRVSIKDNKLSITGTDLEVELIGQSDIGDGQVLTDITLPGRKLIDIFKALPENSAVELYRDNEKVIIKSGRSRFTLSTLPAEDFPSVETKLDMLSFEVAQAEFKQLLVKTCFAMAHEDVRYYLNGLMLECDSSVIRAVATDGHRLALSSYKINTATTQRLQIIVPRKGIVELMRMLSNDAAATAQVSIGSNFLKVATDDFIFTTKLIDGRFPEYDRVVPKTKTDTLIINREELKQALTRTSVLCNEKFKAVQFELRTNLLRILSNNPEQEAAEDELVVDYAGNKLDIGFNVAYLMDVINITHASNIKLSFNGPDSSVLIEEVDQSDSMFVIMPMRL